MKGLQIIAAFMTEVERLLRHVPMPGLGFSVWHFMIAAFLLSVIISFLRQVLGFGGDYHGKSD